MQDDSKIGKGQAMTTYLGLCTEYYDLDKPVAMEDALAFYKAYVENASGPILEPMCGTGRFLIPILEAGFDIGGFDASPHMLEALCAKCRVKSLVPKVWEQFLQDINLDRRYELIFIADAFGLITDLGQAKLCLQKIYDHLVPGGKFLFDIEMIHSVPDQLGRWRGAVHHKPDGKMIVLSTLPMVPINQVYTVLCRYELVEQGQIVKTEIENIRIRLYEPDEMDSWLESIGFRNIRRLRAYSQTGSLSGDDTTVIYECMK